MRTKECLVIKSPISDIGKLTYERSIVCKPGQSQADCNLKNPGQTPEPWTQTFLRETVGGAGMDCTIIGTNLCAYYFNSLDGAGDDPLLRARYKYVRYNIYSKLSANVQSIVTNAYSHSD